jgi:hypothetical protein
MFGNTIGFTFIFVKGWADLQIRLKPRISVHSEPGRRATTLLKDVREFMRNKPPPGDRLRMVLSVAKRDMGADRVSIGMHRRHGLRRASTGMHSHMAKIVTEAMLHEGARLDVKRLARRAKDFVNDRWNDLARIPAAGEALQRRSLLRALLAFASRDRMLPA